MKYAIALGLTIALISTAEPSLPAPSQSNDLSGPPAIRVQHCLLTFGGDVYSFWVWFSLDGSNAYKSLTWRVRVDGAGWVDLTTKTSVRPVRRMKLHIGIRRILSR